MKARVPGSERWLLDPTMVLLAFMLQGLVFWRFIDAGQFAGARALVFAVPILGLSLAFALRTRLVPSLARSAIIMSLLASAVVLSFAAVNQGETEYGSWKLKGFIIFAVVPALVIHYGLGGRQRALAVYFKAVVALTVLYLAVPVVAWLELGKVPLRWTFVALGIDVISVARALGAGGILAFAFAMRARRPFGAILASGGLCALGMQFLVGERGPILASAAGLAVLVWRASARQPSLQRRRALRAAFVIGVGIATALAVMSLSARRYSGGYEEQRLAILQRGYQSFLSSPWTGVGLGHFALADAQQGSRGYVHNLVAEVAIEGGLIGLGVLAFYFVVANRRRRPQAGRYDDLAEFNVTASLALLAYALVAAMVSGDLVTNNMVWVYQAMLTAARDH